MSVDLYNLVEINRILFVVASRSFPVEARTIVDGKGQSLLDVGCFPILWRRKR